MKLLLKGGKLLNPSSNKIERLDIKIIDGIVKELGHDLEIDKGRVIDVEGLYIAPGFIDIHTHLREPGFEYKETIKTGTRSAIAGGYTTIACMPNTNPTIDNKLIVEYVKQKSLEEGYCKILIIGSITKKIQGKELTSIEDMLHSGIVAISDDGNTPLNEDVLYQAFLKSVKHKIPIISHCEDLSVTKGASVNMGKISRKLNLLGFPPSAEYEIVKRDIKLAERTGAKLHIAHISTKESVELIRQGKKKGINVTCEVAPHHFILTEDIIKRENTLTKVNPPLRTQEDVDAIITGIFDGTIDIIATDHAPHDMKSKEVTYSKASFGISGLETGFPLSYTELVLKRKLPLLHLIKMMSLKPAEIINIDSGYIQEDKVADLVVLNLKDSFNINSRNFFSKGKNTPFDGKEVKGKIVYTIAKGNIVFKRGGNK